jgi:hypothetical protein
MYCGKDWNRGIRQAQANANANQMPWIVWMYISDVHISRASEGDLIGQTPRSQGAKIIDPEEDYSVI